MSSVENLLCPMRKTQIHVVPDKVLGVAITLTRGDGAIDSGLLGSAATSASEGCGPIFCR